MKARDLMATPVYTISPTATVHQAAELMLEKQISALPVVDEQGNLVGILTHTDFALQKKWYPLAGHHLYKLLGSWTQSATLEEVSRSVREKKVEEVMSQPVVTVTEDMDAPAIAELMLRKGINRLPVVRDGAVVGIVCRHDLMKLMSKGFAEG